MKHLLPPRADSKIRHFSTPIRRRLIVEKPMKRLLTIKIPDSNDNDLYHAYRYYFVPGTRYILSFAVAASEAFASDFVLFVFRLGLQTPLLS